MGEFKQVAGAGPVVVSKSMAKRLAIQRAPRPPVDAAAEADYAQRSNDRAGVNDPAVLDALLKGGQQ